MLEVDQLERVVDPDDIDTGVVQRCKAQDLDRYDEDGVHQGAVEHVDPHPLRVTLSCRPEPTAAALELQVTPEVVALAVEAQVLATKRVRGALRRTTIDPECALVTPMHKMLGRMSDGLYLAWAVYGLDDKRQVEFLDRAWQELRGSINREER